MQSAAAAYPVEFDGFTSLLGNPVGFRGAGEMAINDGVVTVTGRRRALLRWQAARESFPVEAIQGAQLDGVAVRLVIQPGRTRFSRQILVARFADAVVARGFVARLDAARVPRDWATDDASCVDFDTRVLLLHPHAPLTPILVALNVAVFLAMALAGAGLVSPHPEVHIRWGANFGPLTTSGEWWRLATSVFIHFGLLHLAVNMLALWDAGRLVERLYGSAHFLFVYLASGVAGALASVAWNPWVNSAGASGAIFGVFGALLAYVLDRRNGVPPAVMRSHRTVTLLFLGYSLAYGFVGANVDNAAHLGGLAAGFGLGFMLALPLADNRPIWRPASVAAAAVALAAACAIALQAVRDTGPAYRAELEFKAALDHAIAEGKRMEDAGETPKGAFLRYQRREISRAELVRAIEADVAFHEREIALFRAMKLDPASPSGWPKARDTLVASLELRRDALALAARAIRDGNGDLMKSAEKKMAEANALVQKARAAQEARKSAAQP